MTYVLGVDGGTTKTVALIADGAGTILGAGRAGGANIYAERPVERALDAVECAVDTALDTAGLRRDGIDVAVCSMAGADWPEDITFLQEALQRRRIGRAVLVVNDALGALRAGSPDGTGIVVACGTGAAVGARTAAGRVWYSGFWQHTGGSHDLAQKALHAVYQAALGLAPPTALAERALTLFAQPSVEGVLHLLTRRGGERPTYGGALTRALLDEAHGGDAVATHIVRDHGTALGDYAVIAARQVDLVAGPVTLVLTGGVLRHPSSVLREAIVARVRARLGDACPLMSRFEPAVGALLLALEAGGVTADTSVIDRLAPTLPPPALFDT